MTAILAFVEMFALVLVTVVGRFALLALGFGAIAAPIIAGATLCATVERRLHAAI